MSGTVHYCYVCHKRKASPPDGRCRKCRAEGAEFISFSDIPKRLAEIEEELKMTESELLREFGV